MKDLIENKKLLICVGAGGVENIFVCDDWFARLLLWEEKYWF